ncbi:hypothetical protein GCM10027275_17840 [Rhabdobacter roseus]
MAVADKSIPPVRITYICPIAAISNGSKLKIRLQELFAEKNPGTRSAATK